MLCPGLEKMWVGLMGKLQTIVDSRLLPGTQSLYRAKGKLKNNGTVYRSFRSQQGYLQALSSTCSCPESSPASKNATLQGRDDARLLSSTLQLSYRQAQVSTDILGYTFRTTFRFSSRKRTPREFILSGTQHGSGMPGTIPTALTMLWMVA